MGTETKRKAHTRKVGNNMKTIEINSINFEKMGTKFNPYTWSKSDIYDLYKRPSQTKVEIFNEWKQFFREVGTIDTLRVHGNSMMFVIVADVIGKDGNRYNFYITKAHNRVYIY